MFDYKTRIKICLSRSIRTLQENSNTDAQNYVYEASMY